MRNGDSRPLQRPDDAAFCQIFLDAAAEFEVEPVDTLRWNKWRLVEASGGFPALKADVVNYSPCPAWLLALNSQFISGAKARGISNLSRSGALIVNGSQHALVEVIQNLRRVGIAEQETAKPFICAKS